MIKTIKLDLKEKIKNFSKLFRTLNKIENKFQTIEKQKVD